MSLKIYGNNRLPCTRKYYNKIMDEYEENKMKLQKEESEYLSPKEYNIGTQIPFEIVRYEGAKSGKFGNVHEVRIINSIEENPLKIRRLITLFKSDYNDFIDRYGDESTAWDGKKGLITVVEYTNSKGEKGKKFEYS